MLIWYDFTSWAKNQKFSKFPDTYEKLWGHDIINSHLNIHKDFKKCFPKKCEINSTSLFLIIFKFLQTGKFLLFIWNYGNSGLDFPFKHRYTAMQPHMTQLVPSDFLFHSHCWGLKQPFQELFNWILVQFCKCKCVEELWGDDIINCTHVEWFIRTGQELFSDFHVKFPKCHNCPYFLSDFHHVCTNL